MSKQTETNAFFYTHGFVKAGGMWGDAQWLRINRTTIVSIGGSFVKYFSKSEDYTSAPHDLDYPCKLTVYNAEECANHDLNGEPPPIDDGVFTMLFETAEEAVNFVMLMKIL